MPKTSLDKKKIKILLLEGIHASAVEAFRADGYTGIEYHEKSLPEPQLLKSLGDTYFLGVRSATQLSAAVFERAPSLTVSAASASAPTRWTWIPPSRGAFRSSMLRSQTPAASRNWFSPKSFC
jgi:hypothetical protein